MTRTIVWPTVGLWSASTPGGDVHAGARPRAVTALAAVRRADHGGRRPQFDASMLLTLGALLADVPHIASRAADGHGDRADDDRSLRPAALSLRGADRHRRRAARRVRRASTWRPPRCGRPCPRTPRRCRRRRPRWHWSSGPARCSAARRSTRAWSAEAGEYDARVVGVRRRRRRPDRLRRRGWSRWPTAAQLDDDDDDEDDDDEDTSAVQLTEVARRPVARQRRADGRGRAVPPRPGQRRLSQCGLSSLAAPRR